MTIKEAILKSLEDLNRLANSVEICEHILQKKYSEFGGKTPQATVSAQLGDFIRNGDSRVKRIKQKNGMYSYYLAKNEKYVVVDDIPDEGYTISIKHKANNRTNSYDERDLHILLSSYLKNTDVFSKTIFHEQSNGKDNNQIWTHPDMIGIKFLNLQNIASQN